MNFIGNGGKMKDTEDKTMTQKCNKCDLDLFTLSDRGCSFTKEKDKKGNEVIICSRCSDQRALNKYNEELKKAKEQQDEKENNTA